MRESDDIKPRQLVNKMNTTLVDLKYSKPHEPVSCTILPDHKPRSRISARTPAQG